MLVTPILRFSRLLKMAYPVHYCFITETKDVGMNKKESGWGQNRPHASALFSIECVLVYPFQKPFCLKWFFKKWSLNWISPCNISVIRKSKVDNTGGVTSDQTRIFNHPLQAKTEKYPVVDKATGQKKWSAFIWN